MRDYAGVPAYICMILLGLPCTGLQLAPLTPIALDQALSGLWPPGLTRRGVGEIARGQRRPDIENRDRRIPGSLNDVVALEQGGIANHRVIQERLIACARFSPE